MGKIDFSSVSLIEIIFELGTPYYKFVLLFILILSLLCNISFFLQDDNVKSLLCSLICCRSSMTAEQVLNADCFLLPKGKSMPNSEKYTEYIPKKEEEELKVKKLLWVPVPPFWEGGGRGGRRMGIRTEAVALAGLTAYCSETAPSVAAQSSVFLQGK